MVTRSDEIIRLYAGGGIGYTGFGNRCKETASAELNFSRSRLV